LSDGNTILGESDKPNHGHNNNVGNDDFDADEDTFMKLEETLGECTILSGSKIYWDEERVKKLGKRIYALYEKFYGFTRAHIWGPISCATVYYRMIGKKGDGTGIPARKSIPGQYNADNLERALINVRAKYRIVLPNEHLIRTPALQDIIITQAAVEGYLAEKEEVKKVFLDAPAGFVTGLNNVAKVMPMHHRMSNSALCLYVLALTVDQNNQLPELKPIYTFGGQPDRVWAILKEVKAKCAMALQTDRKKYDRDELVAALMQFILWDLPRDKRIVTRMDATKILNALFKSMQVHLQFIINKKT
jgi:hypothetical protein